MNLDEPRIVDSPLGRHELDSTGSPVGVARMDPDKSYTGIGQLLQTFINNGDPEAWDRIRGKIDYTFQNLDPALTALEGETGFCRKIKSDVERGMKLFFKPNLVSVENIDPRTHGPGSGSTACTEWPFVAALMRWFHEKLGISYFDCVDQLTGSNLKKGFLETFDENEDGRVSYEETGRRGVLGARLYQVGLASTITASEPLGYLRGPFGQAARRLKWSNPDWNPEGHDIFAETDYPTTCWTAYRLSQNEIESPDPYSPGLLWGKGKWPSFQLARYITLGMALYGDQFPDKIVFPSLYGWAFLYAGLTRNGGQCSPDSLDGYIRDAGGGKEPSLDFTLYVPEGYDALNGSRMPNVETTADPALVFTAHFSGGKEVWPSSAPIY